MRVAVRMQAVAMVGLLEASAIAQIPCGYEIAAVIQAPPCAHTGHPLTAAIGISPNGHYICGYYQRCDVSYHRAFVFDTLKNQFLTIPEPSDVFDAIARDVNDAGIVVGTCQRDHPSEHGFAYSVKTGVWTHISAPHREGWSNAYGINSSNMICGSRSVDDGGDPVLPKTAFVYDYSTGQFTELGLINGYGTSARDINDAGAVTGQFVVNLTNTGFIWMNGELNQIDTLAGLSESPWAINSSNTVVGQSLLPNPHPPPTNINHGFLWIDKIIDLGSLPGDDRSSAGDINDDGVIVGFSRLLGTPDRGVVWFDGEIHDLNELVNGKSDITIYSALGIDAAGKIIAVGSTGFTQGSHGLLLTPVKYPLGDATRDCVVNVVDLLLVIGEWEETSSPADLNSDGIVDQLDLLVVLENWTSIE